MNTAFRKVILSSAIGACALLSFNTYAAVSAEEAAKLKTELTPFGAERKGNADGSIPAWDGGLKDASSVTSAGKRGDPFSSEKPLFTITSANMEQYKDKLSIGTQAMLKKYPDSYKLEVYKTHRTAAAPESVYAASLANATSVSLVQGAAGPMPSGGAGGIPFPVAKTGEEAIWNHLLRWRGSAWQSNITQYLTTADGKHVLTNNSRVLSQMPWFQQGNGADKGVYWELRILNDGPPLRAGEAILGVQNIDAEKTSSWTYLPGQRRVRRLPNACCDTPTPATAGVMSFDEVTVFQGRIDRFDWKLVGKREMYIPYNANGVFVADKPEDIMLPRHLNPGVVRWELHRVWVVEATLKSGARHVMPKSTYYLDEDTWSAVLGERYDGKGQLSKPLFGLPTVMPDIPAVATTTTGFYDLVSGTWFVGDVFAGSRDQYKIVEPFNSSVFTADSLAGDGIR